MKTVLLDLIADWRKCVCPLEGHKPTCIARRGCADHLEAELTPFVQDLGAKIMEQSEAARIHGQYEVCIALKTAVETMEDALLGPELLACGRVHRGESHDAHEWTVQPEDDSPHTERVNCPGYKSK